MLQTYLTQLMWLIDKSNRCCWHVIIFREPVVRMWGLYKNVWCDRRPITAEYNIFKVELHYLNVGPRRIDMSLLWWCHQTGTFSALLAICVGNSPVPGEFPTQRPVTRSFDIFIDLHPNKRLSKQWWGWWFETSPCPLRRHRNDSTVTRHMSVNVSQITDSWTIYSTVRSFDCKQRKHVMPL